MRRIEGDVRAGRRATKADMVQAQHYRGILHALEGYPEEG